MNPKKNYSTSVLVATLAALLILFFSQESLAGRGLRLQLKDPSANSTQSVQLYGGSYALLVGGSNYTHGWSDLESVPRELAQVESLLASKGFVVEKHLDPDHNTLSRVFEQFINKHGYDPNNRLLFFYSGHGYTRKDGRKGYLVPVDAPNPNKDEFGFVSKSLSMNQILFWARDIEAKHALFLFDSCFSGTVFKQRELPKPPKHINKMATLPVRQFITAGMAGETVPAVSTFTPAFIDGLKFNLADLNGDGFVSGTELGLYLQEKVPQYVNQTPQFGKITDYELSRGDFIFVAGGSHTRQDKSVVNGTEPVQRAGGELKVTSRPSGAEVFFNGRRVGQTPVEYGNIDPGQIEVTVSKMDYLTGRQTAHINKGRKTVLNFEMIPKISNGFLTIYSAPSHAKIGFAEFSGAYRPSMELPPGKYQLEVSAPGYVREERTVSISANQHLKLEVKLEKIQTAVIDQKVVVSQPAPRLSAKGLNKHSAKIVRKRGNFVIYEDGVVEDESSGLMWPEKDNGKDVNWLEASFYCSNYRGGGYSDWRLPTVNELKILHAALAGKEKAEADKPVNLSKDYIWSGKTREKQAAFFYFDTGSQLWFEKDHSRYLRVLPGRSVH